MMRFRQTVVGQIKTAADKHEIEHVILNSVQRLKDKNVNGHIIQRYILAMDYTLDQEKMADASEKTWKNLDIAIALFRKLQRS